MLSRSSPQPLAAVKSLRELCRLQQPEPSLFLENQIPNPTSPRHSLPSRQLDELIAIQLPSSWPFLATAEAVIIAIPPKVLIRSNISGNR